MGSKVFDNPPWKKDDPGYSTCEERIWEVAEGLAGKFLSHYGRRSNASSLAGMDKEDLSSEAVLHLFLKLRNKKFTRTLLNIRDAEGQWRYIRRLLWNRMLDVTFRKASNVREIQAPTPPLGLNDEDIDSDEALETIAYDRPLAFGVSPLRRQEIQELEDFIGDLLRRLPHPMGLLLQLRFGLWRSDELGSEFPQTGEPLTLAVLVNAGFGDSDEDVHERVQRALERLREAMVHTLSEKRIGNFEGYHGWERQ
jgi:hypothetical protein